MLRRLLLNHSARFVRLICVACTGPLRLSVKPFTELNLAIGVINTDGGQTVSDAPGVLAYWTIYDKPGVLVTNNITTGTPIYTGKIAIETRGSLSQFFRRIV